jgi:uncharacterized protein
MASRLQIDNKPFLQLILILSLCLIFVILFSIIGALIMLFGYGADISAMNNYGDPKIIEGLKFFQLMSAIGLFIVPPITYALITSKQSFKSLGLKTVARPFNYLLVLLLMIASTPFISWIIELNASMVLPEFLAGIEQWMKASETQAGELTKAFLTFDGVGSLIYMLVVIAIVPAIGEELLFRGVLQKIFINWFKKPHMAIWFTAILFSALHMQFFGFFPRMLLGVLFGYIFFWSKSLWLPILGHFINNGSVVLLSYFYPETIENADVSIFEGNKYSIVFYIISFVLSMALILVIKKVCQKKSKTTSIVV